MEQVLFYFVHWVLPILIGLSYIIRTPRSKWGLFTAFVFNVSFLWFIFLWGQWPIAGTLFFKYILVFFIGFHLFWLIRGFFLSKKKFPKGAIGHFRNIVLMLFGVLFSYLIFQAFKGRNYHEEAFVMEFPLKNGDYYVASGGSNRLLNNHFGRGSRSQQFALDINKLEGFGKIATGLGSATNDKHFIFGTPVYAPCSGRVLALENNVADNKGSDLNVDASKGQGNFVVLDCNGTVVTLVHLQQGSVVVNLGERVETGSLLGRVGNSGFSQEPHLHLQAARWSRDSLMLGIPMEFSGELPYRNYVVKR